MDMKLVCHLGILRNLRIVSEQNVWSESEEVTRGWRQWTDKKIHSLYALNTVLGVFIVAPCILIFTQFIHQQIHIYYNFYYNLH